MSHDQPARRDGWAGWAAAGTLLALSAGVMAVALATASGVTYVGNSSYETEFVNPRWGHVGWLLCVPVFATAWRYPTAARLSVLGAAAPQWVGMWVVLLRYAESFWFGRRGHRICRAARDDPPLLGCRRCGAAGARNGQAPRQGIFGGTGGVVSSYCSTRSST